MYAFEQAFEIDRTSESYFKRKWAVWCCNEFEDCRPIL